MWQPVTSEPELFAKLVKFYDEIPGETLSEEKIKKASTAYLKHQELLHFRLFKKYGVKLFDPAPLKDPEALKNPVGFYKKGAYNVSFPRNTGKVSPVERKELRKTERNFPPKKRPSSWTAVFHCALNLPRWLDKHKSLFLLTWNEGFV